MKHLPRRLILVGLIVLGFAAILITSNVQANSTRENVTPNWELVNVLAVKPSNAVSELHVSTLPPPARQDPCLHCHIAGEEKGLWTPTLRWAMFGTAGIIFAFGIVRASTIWQTKAPWKSLINRASEWIDERYEISKPLNKILSKPVPQWQRRWWYCLGGLTAFAFIIQGITGVMLAFYYKPTPEAAYASIIFIENEVYLGSMIRMVHHWSANFMIVLCIAHMLRVFIMGAFKPPRELNWVSGVVLFIVTLAFGFTGYLLPWDQRAYWATTVGTEIAGSLPIIGDPALILLRVGWNITDLTLSRFYGLHVIVVPVITVVMMGLHFMMVRKQGIMKPL